MVIHEDRVLLEERGGLGNSAVGRTIIRRGFAPAAEGDEKE